MVSLRPILLLSLTLSTTITGAYAQSYSWPSTSFRGQPDFNFNRAEVLEGNQKVQQAGRGKALSSETIAPSIGSVIQAPLVNPFNKDAVGREQQQQVPNIELNIQVPQLPELTIEDQLNLDEFSAYLNSLVETASQQTNVDLSEVDFNKELNKVVISAMMTSPDPYVIINGKKFRPGDRFLLPVQVNESTDRIERMISGQMPPPSSVTTSTFQKFEALKDEALQRYRQKRAQFQQENANANTHNVSVTIKEIKHRKVVVSALGEEYTLNIGVAL